MKRHMVNLDDETGARVEARAKSTRRSVSAYICTLIDKDLADEAVKNGGNMGEVHDLAAEVGVPTALKVLSRELVRRTRKSRRAA